MILPNPDLAIIDDDKLAGYSLNLDRTEGKHKARVFKSALNMDASDSEELRQVLLDALRNFICFSTNDPTSSTARISDRLNIFIKD